MITLRQSSFSSLAKFKLTLKVIFFLLVFFHYTVWGDLAERLAWEKIVPENRKDLFAIQQKLKILLAKVESAVVSIESEDGAGSGVVVSEDGLVLTAAHVIGSTGKKMKVILNDGRKLPAVSLGGSEISDAGMLKIKKAESLPFVNISKDDPSVIGDWCFALGHPGGYDPRRGIVVRLGRIIGKKDETIRTDSRLLGGDSGGPLFDFKGNVIAIHSRISEEPDQNFHVPVESFLANWDFFKEKKILTLESLAYGGFLGITCEEVNGGVLILEVIDDTPAHKAGLLPGDVLKEMNGEKISNRENLTIRVSRLKPGKKVVFLYDRKGKLISSKIKIGTRSFE